MDSDDIDEMKQSIAAALQEMVARTGAERTAPKQDPAILAFTLQEASQRHAKGCPFKQGDLVTPRQAYNLKQAGDPHVVMDILPVRPEGGKHGEEAYRGGLARIYDMRVLTAAGDDGNLVAFYAESYCYEAWKGDVAKVN